jgi:hypothetical protein
MRRAVKAKLEAVEGGLVRVEFTSDGDTLNYREKLFEKLSGCPLLSPAPTAADHPVVRCFTSSPTRPTNGCRHCPTDGRSACEPERATRRARRDIIGTARRTAVTFVNLGHRPPGS